MLKSHNMLKICRGENPGTDKRLQDSYLFAAFHNSSAQFCLSVCKRDLVCKHVNTQMLLKPYIRKLLKYNK